MSMCLEKLRDQNRTSLTTKLNLLIFQDIQPYFVSFVNFVVRVWCFDTGSKHEVFQQEVLRG
jgi:hypothetical protein